jgi:hypothetical protein
MDAPAFEAALTRLVESHPTWAELDALCDLYERGTPPQRALLRGVVDLHDGTWTFPPAYLSFRHPERHLSTGRAVRDHLVGYCISGISRDYRDDLCYLAVLYNTAEEAGYAAETLFRTAASVAGPEEARWILDMADRQPRSRGRRAFCLVEAADDVGTYLKISIPPLKP